jgi:hypothetical protein
LVYYELVLADILEQPRDYHWLKYLGRTPQQYVMADYVAGDLTSFDSEKIILLAGRAMILLKESFNNIVRNSGIQIPTGTSAFHALQAECQKGPNECKQLQSAVAAYSAGSVKVDADGKATFPAGRCRNLLCVWRRSVQQTAVVV